MIKFALVILAVAITYISIKIRNGRNKHNSKKYIAALRAHGPDPSELAENVCLRVGTHSTAGMQVSRTLGMPIAAIGDYQIRYQHQLDRHRWLIVTESYDRDILAVPLSRHQTTEEIDIFHMHRFVIKVDTTAEKVDIYSDIHEVLREKLVKTQFANELFEYLLNKAGKNAIVRIA